MARTLRLLAGTAALTGAMCWLDRTPGGLPGAYDRAQRLARRLSDGVEAGVRDLAGRLRETGAALRAAREARAASDELLVEHVHALLDLVVTHPRAIEVAAAGGRITLRGPVLAHERGRLLRAVRAVHGVREVVDEMEVHQTAAGVPALRTGTPQQLQESWRPATRLLAGTAGGAFLLQGLRHGGLGGGLAAAAGAALLARSATNLPLGRLAARSAGTGIELRKTLTVRAPIEQVFETLAHYENFPAFMRNVRSVRREDGRSHWTVAGPAGLPVTWEAETTRYQPNRLLAWRTVPGSIVRHAGVIRLEPGSEPGETRLEIEMSYHPPAGTLGHVVARLFGADPETEMDEDLERLRSYLETGRRPRDAAALSMGAPFPGSYPTTH
jgi:uncharacterized membrane protein